MSEHRDALNQMNGIPSSVGFCEPVEGYRYRPDEAVRSMQEMATEITALRKQLEAITGTPGFQQLKQGDHVPDERELMSPEKKLIRNEKCLAKSLNADT